MSLSALPYSTLPILDLHQLGGTSAQRDTFVQHLRLAAQQFGVFYIMGHGITTADIEKIFALSRQFFALPNAEKQAIGMIHSQHFRGYTASGHELTRGQPDWREQFDVWSERPALPNLTHFPSWSCLQGPNQWPTSLPTLRPTLLGWQALLTEIGTRLLHAIALALHQPMEIFNTMLYPDPVQHMKIIRYPGAFTPHQQGVGAHKDSGLLTLLLQDQQTGLQVETHNGWIDIPPVPGTLIVNMGEALELLSQGYLRAALHRVIRPPSEQDRLSMAFFLCPRLDVTLTPLTLPTHLIPDARGPENDPENPLFYQVGTNLLKGRLRSHPDVAQRYYPDLSLFRTT